MSSLFVVSHLPHRPSPYLTPEPWLQPWGRHLAALLHSLHCYQMHIPVPCFFHCSFQPPPYHFGPTIFPFLFLSPQYMAYYVHILHLLDAVSTTSYSLIPWKGLLWLSVIEITSLATVAIPVPEHRWLLDTQSPPCPGGSVHLHLSPGLTIVRQSPPPHPLLTTDMRFSINIYVLVDWLLAIILEMIT